MATHFREVNVTTQSCCSGRMVLHLESLIVAGYLVESFRLTVLKVPALALLTRYYPYWSDLISCSIASIMWEFWLSHLR